ncbi:hypothetical protein [Lysinibacillus sphaericus]
MALFYDFIGVGVIYPRLFVCYPRNAHVYPRFFTFYPRIIHVYPRLQ